MDDQVQTNVQRAERLRASLVLLALFFGMIALVTAGGCAGRAEILPNSDPALRRSAAKFAADAARRPPYHADPTRAGEVTSANGAWLSTTTVTCVVPISPSVSATDRRRS